MTKPSLGRPPIDLADIPIGQAIWDMHNHAPPSELFAPTVDQTRHQTMKIPNGHQIVKAFIHAYNNVDPVLSVPTINHYSEKELVLIARSEHRRGLTYHFAYSYDGTTLGFIDYFLPYADDPDLPF